MRKKGQEREAEGQDKGRNQDQNSADEYRAKAEIPLKKNIFFCLKRTDIFEWIRCKEVLNNVNALL